MRVYNRFILMVAVLLLLTTVVLVAFKVASLELYYTVYVLETLIANELYGYFNPRVRRGLHNLSVLLFLGFIAIVVVRIAKIVAPG